MGSVRDPLAKAQRKQIPFPWGALILPLLLIACMIHASLSAPKDGIEDQTQIRGNLIEWSEIPVRKGQKTPRFTISGYPNEFRIDPSFYDDFMGRRIPTDFVKGAELTVTVQAAQLALPIRPPQEPSIAIVWVNGLIVSGDSKFDFHDVMRWRSRNKLFLIPLIGAPALFCLWISYLWWRAIRRTDGNLMRSDIAA